MQQRSRCRLVACMELIVLLLAQTILFSPGPREWALLDCRSSGLCLLLHLLLFLLVVSRRTQPINNHGNIREISIRDRTTNMRNRGGSFNLGHVPRPEGTPDSSISLNNILNSFVIIAGVSSSIRISCHRNYGQASDEEIYSIAYYDSLLRPTDRPTAEQVWCLISWTHWSFCCVLEEGGVWWGNMY